MLSNRKIMLTGGAGFIGSYLAGELVQANEVIIYDNFSTGKKENIAAFENSSNLEVLQHDIRDKDTLAKHMSGVDFVFHLAALASVPLSIAEPKLTHEINVTGTQNVLEAALENHVKKVIFSSSAAVYGDDPTLPKLETMPTQARSPYAESKIAGEDLCRKFHHEHGLPTVALRYFNVFGPNQDPSSQYAAVVPKFIECVKTGKPPIIFDTGEQSRDFIYISDVAAANIQPAMSDGAIGEIFNIALGVGTTVNRLAKMIISMGADPSIEPEHRPPRQGDIKHSYADISKAKAKLGWEPKVKIEKALKLTYDSF